MTTIAEMNAGVKLFGAFTGKIAGIEQPRAVMVGGASKIVQDLVLDDGTGSIKVAIWSPTVKFVVGQTIELTGAYTKEYNGKYSINLSRSGGFKILQGMAQLSQTQTQALNTSQPDAATTMTTEIVDNYFSEAEIEAIIRKEKEIEDDSVFDMLIKKNNAGGLLDRREALIIIAKNADLEEKIIQKPYDPRDDMPKKPYSLMTNEELIEWFAKSDHPATRGLIDKVIMHQQWLELTKKKIALKKTELKIMIEVNKVKDEYDKIRANKLLEIERDLPKKKKKAPKKVPKKTTKKKKEEEVEPWDEDIEFIDEE